MKIKIMFLFLFTSSLGGFGQRKYNSIIRGENNEIVKKIDSLSFKAFYLSSQFFVDSITLKPYTGKITIKYADKAIDSVMLKNGYMDGWRKSYHLDNSNLSLSYIDYFDQQLHFYVYNPIFTHKKRSKSAFVKYLTQTEDIYLEIKYKPNNYVIKQSNVTLKGKQKKVIRLKTLIELESYLKSFEIIFPYCQQAGFFDLPKKE